MAGPRHGENAWFFPAVFVSIVPAAIVVMSVYSCGDRRNSFAALDDASRRQIAALLLTPNQSAAVERSWIGQDFSGEELTAPLGGRPCRPAADGWSGRQRADVVAAFDALGQADSEERIRALAILADRDPSTLLLALIAGRELAAIGDWNNAETILRKSLASTTVDDEIIKTAKDPSAQLNLHDDGVRTVIHLYHTLGVVQLAKKSDAPWIALKNVIGAVRMLSRRAVLGLVPGESPESRLTIAAPGCISVSGEPPLSSYDLYNNLIVGYAGGGYTNSVQRDDEFARPVRNNASAMRRLFSALVEHERSNNFPNESELWALSNVDIVSEWRRPDNTRLVFNTVRLLDWWMEESRCPGVVCTPSLRGELNAERDALLRIALENPDVEENEKERFAVGMVSMLASADIDPATVQPQLEALREWLPTNQQGVIVDLLAARAARTALPQWVTKAEEEDQPPWAPLNARANEWRGAALADFASDVAAWAEKLPEEDRARTARAVRRMVEPADVPDSVERLVPAGFDRFWFRMTTGWWRWWWGLLAAVVGLIVWHLLVWVWLQIREYRLLKKSFYEVELDFIDHMDVTTQHR